NMTADEKLAEEVENDFLRRREERRLLERSWELNLNFVKGKQYCGLDAKGELYEDGKDYFWQEKRAFNHIAPIVDMRLSKLSRIRPALVVRAASDGEKDRKSASLASAILSAVQEDSDMDGVMNAAALWSEICGTAFYKVTWNGGKGTAVGFTAEGKTLNAGEAEVTAVSPFEIYPCTLSEESVEGQPSIIHAKALPVEDIYAMYGVELAGRDISEFSIAVTPSNLSSGGDMPQIKGGKRGYEIVIERYEKPSAKFPRGRLAAVAGGKLLYKGDLPYINGENGARSYPFIKQCAIPLAGSFFGTGVVDRLVPLQRAYNAVKNRKHEFLNRISMGTIAVEDGSVDAEELSEDGLMPGKVIVYRQGSKPPEMLTLGAVPSGFDKEEETLLNEFIKVSGTGSISENADSYAGITSATGLQLIIDQDDQRLSVTYTDMKRALKQIGRHILRLYRQFATAPRLLKYSAKGDAYEVIAFKGSDISSDEVMLEADSDLNMTAAQKRTVIYELLDKGLLSDDEGKISLSVKGKLLNLLGYGTLAGNRDLKQLNRDRAAEENSAMLTGEAEVKPYDDHAAHIEEHTAFLLTSGTGKEAEARICAHIDAHKKLLNGKKLSEVENG
ncbi:MAG: hypothetical protein K2N30_04455, partial [Clostridia bacterium]|nr:hypothetical protein [Clostridia bacterium]